MTSDFEENRRFINEVEIT